MKKLLLLLIALIFLSVSCGGSKKAENDTDADILPDEDTLTTDEDSDSDDDDDYVLTDDDEDTDEISDSSPCENFANTDGTIRYYENGNFECGCVEGYFWGNLGCKKITFANICTGQEYCYEHDLYGHTYYCKDNNNPPGQDGYYAKEGYCLKQDFTQRTYYAGETITTDNNLKIQWTNKVGGNYTWEEAIDFCENLEYGGHDDWRLPLPRELLLAGPKDVEDKTELWSSVSLGENAWYINDKHNLDLGYKLMEANVRCVREDPEPEGEYTSSSPRFQTIRINNAEIVRDIESGIIWQKNFAGNLRWIDSMVFCEKSGYAGFSDWRMPNINELTSLADHKNGGVYDFPGFNSAAYENSSFWSSSTDEYPNESSSSYEDQTVHYSHVLDISDGRNGNILVTDYCGIVANALCMRNDPCRNGWFWNGKKCVESPCNSDPCKNDEHSDGICAIEDFGGYSCGCADDYFWNGKKCVSPCDPDPCAEDKNSTGLCVVSDIDLYKCECRDGWFWDGGKCVNPCENADCGKFEHGTDCRAENAFVYSCNCEEGYYWWGENKGCTAKKPAAVNVCTGQNKCYDNKKEIKCPDMGKEFFGQDAHYAEAGYCVPQSFSVVENVPEEPIVIDNNIGMMWQQKISSENRSIGTAQMYCDNLVYGGYSDWRLPTYEEFMTIADYGRYSPAVNTEYFPDHGYFWTNTNYYDYNTTYYKIFDFDELSAVSVSYAGPLFNTRCVRGTEISGNPLIFTQETFGDTLWWNYDNDLIFMKNENSNHTWSEALKYCSELDYAGISDWRLPNVKELFMNFEAEAHTSTTKLSDLSYDHNYKKDGNRENTFCVTNDPCEKGKIWNGVQCVKNPCSDNPCQSDKYSDGRCKVINEELYSCGCDETYYWSQSKMKCSRSCDETPCENKENSNKICYDDEALGYYCGCNEGYVWLDYECIKNCCEPNPCENLENSNGTCVITKIMGHPYCYCECDKDYYWDTGFYSWEDDDWENWTSKGQCMNDYSN